MLWSLIFVWFQMFVVISDRSYCTIHWSLFILYYKMVQYSFFQKPTESHYVLFPGKTNTKEKKSDRELNQHLPWTDTSAGLLSAGVIGDCSSILTLVSICERKSKVMKCHFVSRSQARPETHIKPREGKIGLSRLKQLQQKTQSTVRRYNNQNLDQGLIKTFHGFWVFSQMKIAQLSCNLLQCLRLWQESACYLANIQKTSHFSGMLIFKQEFLHRGRSATREIVLYSHRNHPVL